MNKLPKPYAAVRREACISALKGQVLRPVGDKRALLLRFCLLACHFCGRSFVGIQIKLAALCATCMMAATTNLVDVGPRPLVRLLR